MLNFSMLHVISHDTAINTWMAHRLGVEPMRNGMFSYEDAEGSKLAEEKANNYAAEVNSKC